MFLDCVDPRFRPCSGPDALILIVIDLIAVIMRCSLIACSPSAIDDVMSDRDWRGKGHDEDDVRIWELREIAEIEV